MPKDAGKEVEKLEAELEKAKEEKRKQDEANLEKLRSEHDTLGKKIEEGEKSLGL